MNNPSDQAFTDQISPFKEQKCDSKENIYGDEYPILWYDPCLDPKEKQNNIHSFSQFEEMEKFAKSLNVSFMMIIPGDYDEEKLFQDFRELNETYIRRLLKVEEEFVLKEFGQDFRLLKVYVFYTLEDFKNESSINEEEIEVTMMKDVKDMAKEFREEFVIICYDCNLSSEMKEKIMNKLDIEEKNIYSNFEELLKRINNPKELPYHLILTGKEYNEIKQIIDEERLLGLYIYDGRNFTFEEKNSPKIKVEKTLEDLIPKIQEGIRTSSKLKFDLPAFATDFDNQDRSNIYSLHYYLQGLINFRNRKQAKADFVGLTKKIYQNKSIIQFEKEYSDYNKEEILHWYTENSPIYKVLNNSLRIATSDSILWCRFMLKDMERAIREQYQEKDKDFSGPVYRGAYISAGEWEKLQKNVGKEIEMYGFLSTSTEKRAATKFLSNDPQGKIFITIIIPPLPELDSQGFANASEFSKFKKEDEVLFNVRSRFEILEAQEPVRENGYRHLVLLFGTKNLRRHMTREKPTINLNMDLLGDEECEKCGKKENLFGCSEQEKTRVTCFECLQTNSIPIDVPLVALGNNCNERILKGRILQFKNKVGFENSGYQCIDCGEIGKRKYYKWINFDGKNEMKQCSDCFKSQKKEIKDDILIQESSPFTFWHEEQEKREIIDSGFQDKLSKVFENENESNVYFNVQNYKLCIEYEMKVLDSLKFKRFREERRLKSYFMIAKALEKLGDYKQSLEYLLKIFDFKKSIFGEMHLSIASCYNNLATVSEILGKERRAVELYQRALKIHSSQEGNGEARARAILYNNLGYVLSNLGEYKKAQENCNNAIKICQLIYGENHPLISTAYNNLALVHEKQGDYQKAIEFHQKALNIAESIYGEAHRDTVLFYHNLAFVYKRTGKYQEAEKFYVKALKINLDLNGYKHTLTAHSYNNLGALYESLGDYNKSLEYFIHAQDIWKAVHGEDHPITATAIENIGTLYGEFGEHKKALEYHQKALSIKISSYGVEHPDVAISYGNSATIYSELGDDKRALDLLRKALQIRKSFHGENHLHTANSFHNLASIYGKMKEYDKALEYHRKSLNIIENSYGENHHQAAYSYNGLFVTFWETGKYQEARECLDRAIAILNVLYGPHHPHIANSYANLAGLCMNSSQYREAVEYTLKALEIIKRAYGEKNTKTADISLNLAAAYQGLGDFSKAIEYCLKGINIWKGIYGNEHPKIAQGYHFLALIYSDSRNYNKAEEFFLKAIAIHKRVYGESHPNLQIFYQELLLAYFDYASGWEARNQALKTEKNLLCAFRMKFLGN